MINPRYVILLAVLKLAVTRYISTQYNKLDRTDNSVAQIGTNSSVVSMALMKDVKVLIIQ